MFLVKFLWIDEIRFKPQCQKIIWNLKGVAFKPEKTGLWFYPERAGFLPLQRVEKN